MNMSSGDLEILKAEIDSLYKIEALIRDLRQEKESRARGILAKQVLCAQD